MTQRNLDKLLCPASVAVFGASPRHGSVGATVWRNLREDGFSGPIWPVNPKHSEVDGVTAYRSAGHLPSAPDLALLCTPPDTIAPLIKELGDLGTRAAIVFGPGLGAEQQQAMLQASRPHLLRVLGPRCIGVLNPRAGLNASFAHCAGLPGDLAFVSESGALVATMLDWARGKGIGFSKIVSLGDQGDVDFGDVLDYLASDSTTRAILLYIETIVSPRKFMSAARAAARNKPVIVVKAGRSGQGPRAESSHRGALSSPDLVYDAAIRRAGMLRVDTLQELFDAAQTLTRLRFNVSESLTVVTNGGGAGVLAADAAARHGVPLSELGPSLMQKLEAVLPPDWSRSNPVNILGDAPTARYVDSVTALLNDQAAGTVLFMHAPSAVVPSEEIARALLPQMLEARSRVMTCWLGDPAVAKASELTNEAGMANYATPEDAVRAFAMLQTYRHNQQDLMQTPDSAGLAWSGKAEAMPVMCAAQDAGRQWLSDTHVGALLAAYGVPMVAGRTVAPETAAVLRAAEELGYPVALKVASAQITHKSEVGGVQLGLADPHSLARAVEVMRAAVTAARPDACIDGFTVQAMVRRPHAREILVGTSIDPVFGPVIFCGQGGVSAEVVADRAVALPPLNLNLARGLVQRTGLPRMLGAWRDRPAADTEALHKVLVAVSQMLADLPMLAELDINPLWVDEQGVVALDARVRIASGSPCGVSRFAILPYPSEWVRSLDWRGRPVTLRPIRPEDEPQHARFLDSANAEDMRMRFFCARHAPAHTELARLTQIDYDREMALIVEAATPQGGQETLAVGRTVADPDGEEAEFALMVRSDLKGQGLGRLLLTELIRHARTRGIKRLVGFVLPENTPMLRLAHEQGFLDETDASGDARRVVLQLAAHDVASPAGTPA